MKSSLRAAGLEVHLGHDDNRCPNPGERQSKFVVCDLSRFHQLNLTFCNCVRADEGVVTSWTQLVRAGWYPASTTRPTTAFTFKLLEFFHELMLQGKTNLYDFHRTVARVTNNSGTIAGWVNSVFLSLSASHEI